MKIKKGDTVLIISGKDRTRTGKVLNVFPKEETVLVEGINLRKKHVRPKRSGEKGQIVQVPVPINVSNTKLICQKCSKAVKVGYKREGGKNIVFVKNAANKHKLKNMATLKEKYKKEVIPIMMERFGFKNPMAVPKLEKVVLNSCFGKEVVNKTAQEREKVIQNVVQDLTVISGQKPKVVRAKKSISGFKLRSGIEIAAAVTLRKDKMYDFLERLIYLTLPRSRDFKGLEPKSVDKRGNLTIGFREHIAFPEVVTEREKTIFGLEVTVVTNAKNKEDGLNLFKLLGFPIKEEISKNIKF